jgi:hypothetical protein
MVRNANKDRKLENDIDTLFRLPVTEFIAARNTLTTHLKKSGRGDEANQVKSLAKPTISAWAVNQLYWNHRDTFERLIASGERFRKAQTSRAAGKVRDMRDALNERREALADLSDLAAALLRDAGHNPTPDTIHRVTTTLEAVSAYASTPDGPTPGRLTHDVDPPGFESFASLIPGAGITKPTKMPVIVSPKSGSATNARPKAAPAGDARQIKEAHQARIAAAKVAVQDAKRTLTDARARAQSMEGAQKKAQAALKESEKQKREAEERFDRAMAASKEAARRARSIASEAEEAAKVVEDAKRAVEKATKELESLFRESPGR